MNTDKKQYKIVKFKENQWKRCFSITDDDITELEKKLGEKIPDNLRELIIKCNGGKPEKTYFYNVENEVEIGSLLPVSPPKSFKGQSLEKVYNLLQSTSKSGLIPFAYDTGNAGVFCLDTASGEVIYWIHNYPEEPFRVITGSFDEFIKELGFPPY